ncbi:MAG: VCBS repeat-containing protein [Roseivirga sp.]
MFTGCGDGDSTSFSSKDHPSLFTLTNPDSTGLYFINEVTEQPQLNILTYEYLYNGGGVALGDINKDGLPDVFMTGNLFGGRLFLNKGDLKFEQISETAGVFVGGWSTGVSMVDINQDGYDDIYICRSLTGDINLRRNVLLINNQNNTFTDKAAEYGLDDPSFSHYASWFDYDNDGDLDMYLLNHRIDFKEALKLKYTTNEAGREVRYEEDAETQFVTDKLYRNNGNGSFTDVTAEAGLINRAFGLSITTADLNKDGWADVYVANDYADKDHIYINNGDGTFTDKVDEMLFHMSKNSMGSDIADFNNDGLPDIISLDMMAEDNQRQKQLKGQEPYDLYHAAVNYGLGHQVMRNTVQLNNGNGTFSEIGQLAGVSHTDWSWTPLLADFDNDGYKDLFITNGLYRDLTDLDYRNYTSPQAINRFGGDVAGHALELTQLMPSNPVTNYLYRNEGDLSFSDKSKVWGLNEASFSNGAVYADLDLDGDLDLVTNNFNSEAFLFRNNSREQGMVNYLSIKLLGTPGNPDGVGSKITITTDQGKQYQEFSPYRGYLSSGDAVVHFGLGEQVSVSSVLIEWPGGRVQEITNVKANQRIGVSIDDATERKSLSSGNTSPLLSGVSNTLSQNYRHREDDFIDFKREPLLEHQLSDKGPFVAKADVNGDGLEDIYLGGAAGSAGQLYLQQSDGDFQERAQPAFASDGRFEDAGAGFLDIDGDGDQDLFVSSGGYGFTRDSEKYQNRLYLNNGQGDFANATANIPAQRDNSTAVAIYDIDDDGDLDIFVGGGTLPGSYPQAATSRLLINNGGLFTDASDLLPNQGKLGMINDALWMDCDGDKKEELILAGEWMPVTVLKFEGSKSEVLQVDGLEQSSGWWNTLEVADMDGDGDLDLIAGNRGTNSFYGTTEDQPAMIYAKDFDNNGQIDAFPFYYFNDGKSHPKHTLQEVAAQYPAIRRKFTRYAPYSAATLEDIFSSDDLEDALVLSAKTFSSTWFQNQEDGTFKAQPLPREAQFSEVHGILPIDLNKDGHLDLILTGNNYGADVEAGQNDASIGTVLLNDGKGNFNALTVLESGFSIPGDTRSVVQVGNTVLVMVNDGKPYSFELSE